MSKTRRRKKAIPDTGFALHDRNDLKQFLAKERQQELADAESRCAKSRNQLTKLEEKLAIEQATLRKYRLEDWKGTLNKRYRFAAKVAESVKKLENQVCTAKTELAAKERH